MILGVILVFDMHYFRIKVTQVLVVLNISILMIPI